VRLLRRFTCPVVMAVTTATAPPVSTLVLASIRLMTTILRFCVTSATTARPAIMPQAPVTESVPPVIFVARDQQAPPKRTQVPGNIPGSAPHPVQIVQPEDFAHRRTTQLT